MKFRNFCLPFLFLLSICFPFNANAILVGSGDIIRVDFDLSAESPAPPYDGIYTSMAFGAADYLNIGEGFTIGLFDDGGEGLTDGTGYYLLFDIIGTFDLTDAWAAGRFYAGSTVTDSTDYIAGTISLLGSLPDLGQALAALYTVENTEHENISGFGHDRLLFPQEIPVPEPSSVALLGLGLVGLGIAFYRKAA